MFEEPESKYEFCSPERKHKILSKYKRRSTGHGFRQLAKDYDIRGGPSVIQYWYSIWDGTVDSLKPHAKGHRPPALTPAEADEFVTGFVAARRSEDPPAHVQWSDVQDHVLEQTGKLVPLGTLRGYGHAEGVHVKRAREVTDYSREYPRLPGCAIAV